jgi:hypothetical protein
MRKESIEAAIGQAAAWLNLIAEDMWLIEAVIKRAKQGFITTARYLFAGIRFCILRDPL